MSMQSIRSITSTDIFHVAPETPVAEALEMMSNQKISCLVVMLQNTAVGTLTERDFVHAANKVLDYPSLQVREVMSSPILTVDARDSVIAAYRLLKENMIRNLVVLDENYDVEGIVSLTDIVHKLHAEYFAQIPSVEEIMTRELKTVTPEQSAKHALSLMARHSISCIVVVHEDRPVGIFTEKDAASLIAGNADALSEPIESFMSRPVEAVPATTSPRQAAELMKEKNFRRLLIVDKEGRMQGLVTQSDISRVLEKHYELFLDPGTISGPESTIKDYHHLPFSQGN